MILSNLGRFCELFYCMFLLDSQKLNFLKAGTTAILVLSYIHHMRMYAQSFQSCLILCHPRDCSTPVSVHEMSEWVSEWSHSVVSDSATPWTVTHQASPSMGFFQARVLLCKKAGVSCHALLQWTFTTQGANPHLLSLLHGRQILYLRSYLGNPIHHIWMIKWCN